VLAELKKYEEAFSLLKKLYSPTALLGMQQKNDTYDKNLNSTKRPLMMNSLKQEHTRLFKVYQSSPYKLKNIQLILLVINLTAISSLLIACTSNQRSRSILNMPATEYVAPDKPLINPNNDPFAIQ